MDYALSTLMKGNERDQTKEEPRKRMISSSLKIPQKMEMYNAVIGGRLREFQNLIENKNYPILEEISAEGYYWTSLHYAMYYGK